MATHPIHAGRPSEAFAREQLLHILRRSHPAPGEAAPPLSDADWAEVVRLATQHRLAPLLHHAVREKGWGDAVPGQARAALAQAHQRLIFRNLLMYKALIRVAGLFAAEQLEFMALKGAFLAKFAYPALGLRPMRDLDLLLRPEQAVRAFECLRANGYRPLEGGMAESYLDEVKLHLPPLLDPDGIVIEIHHRLLPAGDCAQWADAFHAGVWERAIFRSCAGAEIRFPSVEDLLFHLCHHATAGHHFSLGPVTLADVAFLLEKEQVEWDRFLRLAVGPHRRCALAPLQLAADHLGADVPARVLAALSDTADAHGWKASAEYLLFSAMDHHNLLPGAVQRIVDAQSAWGGAASLARTLFPSRHALSTHFQVRPDSLSAFLFYPANWLRLLRSKLPALMLALFRQPRMLAGHAKHKQRLGRWFREGSQPQPVPLAEVQAAPVSKDAESSGGERR